LLLPGLAQAAGQLTVPPGAAYVGDVLTISANGSYTIGMSTPGATTTTDSIKVNPGVTATITLNGVKIDLSSPPPANLADPCSATAFEMAGAGTDITLNLANGSTNELASGWKCAGLSTTDAKLTINGTTGSLKATGGYGGAGIGGSSLQNTGTLTINGGVIEAIGGDGWVVATVGTYAGNGIGPDSSPVGVVTPSDITITGGTVTARGGQGASNTVNSAGSGCGIRPSNNITISGGKVTAYGGDVNPTNTAAIISGSPGVCGRQLASVTLSGNADVSAYGGGAVSGVGGLGAPGIGSASGLGSTITSTTFITGNAKVYAEAGVPMCTATFPNVGGSPGIGVSGTPIAVPNKIGVITIDTTNTVTAVPSAGCGTGGNSPGIGVGGYVVGDGLGIDGVPPNSRASSKTVPEGSNTTLACPANPAFNAWQWQKLDTTGAWNDLDGVANPSAIATTLALSSVTKADDEGQYRCIAKIQDGGGVNVVNFAGGVQGLTVVPLNAGAAAAAVPTLGEWALMLLALSVLGMGAVGYKRRA
jgi:hypothetical protein